MLLALITLAVIGYLAYWEISRGKAEQDAPKQTLENVRAKAKEIEANDQKYINDLEKRTNQEHPLDPNAVPAAP
jgi:hypothetical protein